MTSTIEALQNLYVAKGGTLSDVADLVTIPDMLTALANLQPSPVTRKALITIIDDDGTNRTDDDHTGIRSFLHNKNIPMAFAVPSEVPGNGGAYTIGQLTQMVSEGDEVVMHGVNVNDDSSVSLSEFKTMVDSSVEWANTNDFSSDVFVYPRGLQPTDTNFNEKIEYLSSKGIKAAYSINCPVESSETENYEEWYSYENGYTCHGTTNAIPFATMPNGYSKKLFFNRMELRRATLTAGEWWNNIIVEAIENKNYITFLLHSFSSEWSTEGTDGKTTTQLFEEFITNLVENYGDQIEFVTPTEALAYIK